MDRLNPRSAEDSQDAVVQRTAWYAVAFYAALSAVCAALCVVNVCGGTLVGAVSTGGLALLMAYRSWSRHGRMNQQ